MMLVEETIIADEALPIAPFKAHLKLGTGFLEDDIQDELLGSYLRSAMAAIEARTGKALLQRDFTWTLTSWRERSRQPLPIAPVAGVSEIVIMAQDGAEVIVDPQVYRLIPDESRPCIVAAHGNLPAIERNGMAVLRFQAGFSATWEGMPADLAQAVLLLAAHFYEYRDAVTGAVDGLPLGVLTLIQRYKTVRLFAGGRT